jgi:peptide/nickel transport system substrate-binding protein
MSQRDTEPIERRRFLKLAQASGGVAAVGALAGCSGQSNETETESETSDSESGETDSSNGGGELGDPLPSYRYYNNPANYNPARHDAINLIGGQLNEAGIDVGVEVFEWGTLYSRVREEQNFELCTWNHTHDMYPGLLMFEFFHSSNNEMGGGNFTGWDSEETDELLSTSMTATDADERIDALHQFQEVITEAAPTNPIVQMPSVMAYNSDQVSGWSDHIRGPNYFYNMTQIEVDNEQNQLRGSWSETIGTLNVVGAPAQSKVLYQTDVLYDKLIRFDPNLEVLPEAGLASDWSRPDTTTLQFEIRDHQWHDGEALTPEDVAFTFNYIKEYQAPLYAVQTQMYDDAEVLDDGTVQINLNEENAPGPAYLLLASQVPIIPKHIWEERDTPLDIQVTEPVGSGPLAFDYWDQGSELSLVKNDDHFYPVSFDSRVWRIIPEISTVWELLRNGDLNYLPFSRIGRQLAQNEEDQSQVDVYQMPGNGWWHLSMNTRTDGLDDRAVRQALVHAIPKTAVTEQMLYGYPKPGFNLVNESFGQYHNPDVMRYEEGVDVAKERLREGGYVFDEDGLAHFPAE